MALDLTGWVSGRLTALRETGKRRNDCVLWECVCECGNTVEVTSYALSHKLTKSCGCLSREIARERHLKHGLSGSGLYNTWMHLLQRCGYTKGASECDLRLYRDRGITVCDEWRDFEVFYAWSVANGYREGLQIDRKDNNKGYCPENCRWATPKENANNRRNTLRLPDGTPLAIFCSGLGLVTSGDSNQVYNRIRSAWKRHRVIHPDLMSALQSDIDKQECLLRDVITIRERMERVITRLCELKSVSESCIKRESR